jgi:hypothetical protein
MYYTGEPEFQFGHGLSYDEWALRWHADPPLSATRRVVELTTDIGSKVAFSIAVQNMGAHGGSATVLAFWRPLDFNSQCLFVLLHATRLPFGTQLIPAGDGRCPIRTVFKERA